MIQPPESVLVLRFSAVGDVILTAPAIEALHEAWPTSRIFFAVKAGLAHLVAHNPCVHEVIPLHPREGILPFSRRLRDLHPGALLDLHGKIRSKILRLLLPKVHTVVPRRRGLRETFGVKLALRPFHASMRLADGYHLAVERLVGRRLPPGKLRYYLGPEDRSIAEAALLASGVDAARPIVGVSPGANWETKRWPVERFGQLARRMLSSGMQVVITGSASEGHLGGAIRGIAPGAVDLTGRLDLKGLGGFLSQCAVFVANDSGPMHMARALGVPTLAFFGSTDPAMFDASGHHFDFAGVPCSPCSFFGRSRCPRGHFRCMLDLDVDRAWRSLQPLLIGGRRAYVSS